MRQNGLRNAGTAVAMICLTAGPSLAAIWDGSSSTAWNTGANWDTNAVPATTEATTFDDTGVTVRPTVSAANSTRESGSITFANTTGSYDFQPGGASGQFRTGTITNSASSGTSNSINAPIHARGTSATNTLTFTGDGAGILSLGEVRNQSTSRATRVFKSGTHTLRMTGASIYSADTDVTGGTFLVNGSLDSTSDFDVTSGAVGGVGRINTAITASFTGGILSPGDSTVADTTGSFALGNLDLGPAASYAAQLGGTTFVLDGTEDYDQVVATGTTSLGSSTLTVSFVNSFLLGPSQIFTIVSNDGTDPVVGTFTGLGQGDLVLTNNGYDLRISYFGDGTSITGGNDVVLYTVPEPASLALIALGATAALRRRR